MSRYHRSASLLRSAGRWFHGTSAPEFSRFRPGEAYLTTDSDEAMGFAEGKHLGGSSGGEPRVLEVSLAGGPIVDADEEVSLIIRDEHPELRDIDDLMVRLREEGYRYADFTHPGFASDDIRVRVSLHPEEDLDITPTRSASSESVPARTDKGLDVLINAVSGDMRGSVTVTDPATGHQIGTLDFEHVSDEWHRVTDTGVDEAYRRRGVATLMYNWVERTLGKSLLPSDDQSDDATNFWTDRIGPYDPLDDEDEEWEEETTVATTVRTAQSQEHEEYYTSEACAYFAIALHELYGYPLRILVDEGTEFQAGMPAVAHVYAMDRRVAVDAKGHRSQNDVMADFWDLVDPVVYDVTPSELANEWMGDDDDKPLYGPSESEVAEAKAIIFAEPARYAPKLDDPPSDDATDAGSARANRTAGADWQRTRGAVEEVLRTRRVQGDDLLDALDLADALAAVNAEISPDGLVTLYHRTSQDAAEDIVRTGRMLSKEDRLFFGTHPTGQIEGYGSTAVRVRLPLEKLKLSDVFPSELHVTMMSGAIGTAVPVDAEIVGSGRESRAAYHALSRLAWSRDTLELGTMCGECGSDLDIAGRAGDPDDPLCRACHARRENPPAPPKPSKSWWQWKATRTASALDHGPTFRDWQTKARHTIQDAFSGVEEDDESDWLAIAKSALAATLPHVMYRGFSVPATDAAEAERLGAAAIQSSRRSAPHSFSKAVARSFAVGVEPYWAAGGAISDAGMKHRDKLGQWGVIVSLSVGPNMVDWSCIHDGGGIFGEQVYDHLPFDKPVGEAIADMLIKSGGTHNAEWDLRVKSYPPKSANIEVFQIAPGDTSETEAMWRKWESEWETRDAARASAKSKDARLAAFYITAWWSRDMLDHKLARLDLTGRDATRFRALCEKFLNTYDMDTLYDMCFWCASFLGAACDELGIPLRVSLGQYSPEGDGFDHGWLVDSSGTPFDITAVAHAAHRRETRSGDVTGVAAICPHCGKVTDSVWLGDCDCEDPPAPVERRKRFSDEDEMMEAGYECIERDQYPEWKAEFVEPGRYDGEAGDASTAQAAELIGFDDEEEASARDMARAVVSAEGEAARRAASGVKAEIEAIAAEVRRRLGVDHELEDGEAPQALCLDFARELAAELIRRGYSAEVTQGTFEVDCPDEDAYDEWDSDDFEADSDEDEEEMSAEEVMEQATYFPLHYWVRVTAKGDESIAPIFADITADQFDDECEESFDPVWVWTGETGRHQAERHNFGGPVARLRYHHAMQMLARSAGRKNRPLSGFYGTKIKKVVGGLRDRLLQFSVLLLHRLVEERRFAVILAEISVGADVHMTGSPEIEDPDDEAKGKDIVRWSASKLERIKSRHRVRMSKTAGMDRELDVISEAFIRATSWLETAVPIYAVHMEYLDGISKKQDSPERKAEDRDESFLRKEFDPKIPGMKWDRKNLFAGRPEANSWSLRHMTNIYKHGPTPHDLKPMAMHRGNSGAAVLLDRRIDEMRSSSTAAWSLALSEDESGEYPTFLDAARNLLRACGSALTDDEKLLATEWEKIDDIARGGLSKSSAKKKGPRKPRKGPKKKRWDWSEFIGLKEKDPQERLERQIRKYKRDKGGRFTK